MERTATSPIPWVSSTGNTEDSPSRIQFPSLTLHELEKFLEAEISEGSEISDTRSLSKSNNSMYAPSFLVAEQLSALQVLRENRVKSTVPSINEEDQLSKNQPITSSSKGDIISGTHETNKKLSAALLREEIAAEETRVLELEQRVRELRAAVMTKEASFTEQESKKRYLEQKIMKLEFEIENYRTSKENYVQPSGYDAEEHLDNVVHQRRRKKILDQTANLVSLEINIDDAMDKLEKIKQETEVNRAKLQSSVEEAISIANELEVEKMKIEDVKYELSRTDREKVFMYTQLISLQDKEKHHDYQITRPFWKLKT